MASPCAANGNAAMLSATGLTKRYRSGVATLTVLDGLNLEIRRGETLAIVGESGAGKSTLLHLLGGLDEPSAGLSPLMVKEVFKTLKVLNQQGIGLGVVEQNARSVLKYCDHAYVLREGQVVFQGAAADLLANEDLVKSYLGVRTNQ